MWTKAQRGKERVWCGCWKVMLEVSFSLVHSPLSLLPCKLLPHLLPHLLQAVLPGWMALDFLSSDLGVLSIR